VSERRTILYLVGLGFLFLLLIMAAFLGRAFMKGSVDERTWTEQNETVLSSFPLYPGATEASPPYSKGEPYSNAGSKAAENGPFRGYWTTHTYTLPLGARPDLVVSFYREQLAGWTAGSVQGSSCEITFRRGRAKLDLKTCSDKLTLSVNYREFY
jgi:hypothetical protein